MMKNSRGEVFYGMHFCPGVAQYDDPGHDSFRIFINEDTIRKMNPTFAGRPIFVEHVEGVDEDVDAVRKEADGWVLESFFNESDGKTWAKFIIVSDKGMRAIRNGWRLSNAYVPKGFGQGGVWNGVTYQKEITDGEYEHLAIVQNPRYDESVIMNPEEFKQYNADKMVELKTLANSKKETKMGLKFFKRAKVENGLELEDTMVELELSKKQLSLKEIINGYDKVLNMHGYANGDHLVKVGDKDEMSVNDLVKAYHAAKNDLEAMKKGKEDKDEDMHNDDDGDADDKVDNEDLDIDQMGDVGDRGGDKSLDNEDEDKKKADKEKMKNADAEKAAKQKAIREKAARVKNAREESEFEEEVRHIDLPEDQVARGKARYGSGN